MSRLPLSTLPAFSATARLHSVRAAAEVLHLTPSAISQQIRQLEEQLGYALFDRQGRRLKLNAAGERLLLATDPALAALDDAAEAARRIALGQQQVVRLSVLPSLAQRWLMPRIVRWQQRHPHITLDIHSSQTLVDFTRENFHAGLRVGRGPWRGVVSEPVMDCPLIAVAAPARARRVTPGDHRALAAEPLLGGDDLWRQFLSLCGCRLQGRTVADFNDAGLMLQAAEHDLGIALVREVLAADALAAGQLVRMSPLSLEAPEEKRYWFVYPAAVADWEPLVALRHWLLEEMAPAAPAASPGPTTPAAPAGAAPVNAAAARPGRRAPRR